MCSKLVLKPLWSNGSCTYAATFKKMSTEDQREIEELADQAGFTRLDDIWTPPSGAGAVSRFFERMRQAGFDLEFNNPDGGPFDLQRLHLLPDTRRALEGLNDFELYHLSGWTPVQAEGRLDGRYFYFRARGSYWRFEWGGNEGCTRSPRWWHEESWPSVTGFEAGYMSDEEAIGCILKAVGLLRNGDNDRFCPEHPDYERTVLEGWSAGALNLRIAAIRLGVTAARVLEGMQALEIEIPYTAERELQQISSQPIRRLRPQS